MKISIRHPVAALSLLGVFLLLGCFACAGEAPSDRTGSSPAPARQTSASWPVVAPEHVGMDEAKLAEARDYALRGGGSGCILRGGSLVMAWGDQKQRYNVYSTTKSIAVTALGLAIMDGKVRLRDRAQTHLATVGVPPESNTQTAWLNELTLFHLATQTGGFEKTRGWCEQLFRPGTAWIYSDGGPNWLADCLTAAYGRDLLEVMDERVFKPLRITVGDTPDGGDHDLHWVFNGLDRPRQLNGINRRPFGAGMRCNVDTLAKIGQLYLRGGRWGETQIVPTDFVELVRRAHPEVIPLPLGSDDEGSEAGAPRHYGLLWWNNSDGAIAGVPRDAFWSWGLQDSFMIVIPSLDIVAVRAGDYWAPRDSPKRSDTYNNILKPFLLPICQSVARGAPYPPSDHITSIVWVPNADVREAGAEAESDIWVCTWADDGHLYCGWGDGKGIDADDGLHQGSMGLARIEGGPEDFKGIDFNSESDCCPEKRANNESTSGAWGRKPCGLLMVDGVLYMWVRNANSDGTGEQSHLGWSTDRGLHWEWADWKWEEFGFPNFVNFGRNYTAVPQHLGDYVYVYSPDTPSAYNYTDNVILMRVHKNQIADKAAYEFFAGLDEGQPVWTREINRRKPVFTYPGGCNRMDVVYNAGLKRFLMTMRSGPRQRGNFNESETKRRHHFGIYDAPEPWGPWTTVYYSNQYEGTPLAQIDALGHPGAAKGWGESQRIPSKWISEDGRTIHLIYSGDDRFKVRKAVLTVNTFSGESKSSPTESGDRS